MVAGRIAVFSLAVALLLPAHARAVDLQVVSTVPAQNRFAPAGTTIAITFDQPLLTSSVTSASFRVFGRQTGPVSGPIVFSNGDRTLTITPSRPFAAGEIVVSTAAAAVPASARRTARPF